jgi:hypothetical protein
LCSSGGQVAQTDQALQESQAKMASLLNSDYSASFANQQSVLGAQQARLSALAANPLGYTPEQLHVATTSINDNTANAAKTAIGSAAAYAASHGGADVGSGVAGQIAGGIGSAAAQSKAQQLSSLSQQSQALKQQNMWNAISGLNQVGSEYGSSAGTAIGGANSSANSALNAGAGVTAAKKAGWEELGGVLGGLGGLASAGLGVAKMWPSGGGGSSNPGSTSDSGQYVGN